MSKRKRDYGKYPERKTDRGGWFGDGKYHRIDPSVKYLKPIRRKMKVKSAS